MKHLQVVAFREQVIFPYSAGRNGLLQIKKAFR